MLIEVTAEDIACGVRGYGCECAVARALQRMGHERVSVLPTDCYMKIGRRRFTLPVDVSDRLVKWDLGADLAPFNFTAMEVDSDE